ncbi:hypothetical protein BU14_0052s0025 [Porphyra umbilicalis]|uniref:Phospholipase/carboxylesterase/thioesterase domain-containing protein n=1 Tax=Porphyra umbilicalis TaxID=2786 RepID=A0A1X6PHQ9_PORUM|nr:hypothetical protein BU14_0052s0025 [Porphyra umbilicalis]|eukprot:OSX80409.1 hypothetical protein BU14_0052s0025 [Porphyra umbilicalis]
MVSGGGNARGSASRISGKSKKGAQRWNEKEREVSSTDSAGRPRRWGVSGRRHWHRLLGARVAAAGPRAIAAGRQAARRGLERACATDDCRRAHGASAARGSQTLVSILAALSATYTDLTNLDECGTDDGGGGVGGTLNRPDAEVVPHWLRHRRAGAPKADADAGGGGRPDPPPPTASTRSSPRRCGGRVPRARIVLFGYSLGAAAAADETLPGRAGEPGAVIVSGGRTPRPAWVVAAAAAAGGRVIVRRGRLDVLAPFRTAARLRDLLAAAGAAVTLEADTWAGHFLQRARGGRGGRGGTPRHRAAGVRRARQRRRWGGRSGGGGEKGRGVSCTGDEGGGCVGGWCSPRGA